MYKSFKDLPVWQLALDVSVLVFNMTKPLPRSEDYGLKSQIRRSANSVSANIAEGFGRKTYKDKIHFYVMARGSAFETQSHLEYGLRIGYFDEKDLSSCVVSYSKLIHELNTIIKALNSKP